MSSPAEDPFTITDTASASQPAPAPAKRSLFKNRKPKVTKTADEEAAEAVDFFSRSKEIFPEAIREKRERREREERRKQEKEEERKRQLEEDAARQLEREAEKKQRRYVLDNEQSGDEFNAQGRETRSKSRSLSASRSITPSRHRSVSQHSLTNAQSNSPPAKRRSPRHERRTRLQRGNKNIISLSSDEDDEEDIRIAKQRSLVSGIRGEFENGTSHSYDPYASSPPRTQPTKKRSSSVDEVQQEDEMFPELVAAARAQAAQEQAEKLKAMQRRMGRTKSASSHGSGSDSQRVYDLNSPVAIPSSPLATREVVKEDPIISIYVDSRVGRLGEVIIVKRKLSQRFKDVRMAWCDKQTVQGCRNMSDIEKESIFLSWRGRRVWDVTTAESLGIRVDGRGRVVDEKGIDLGGNVHLEAWTQDAYEAWQKEKKAEKLRIASGVPFAKGEQVNLDDEDDVPQSDPVEQPPPVEKVQDRIKIVLKAKEGEPVKLIVKPTTLIGTIVNGYKVQRAELCQGKIVELWFDGDRLEEESTVGEADVEDMSGVDVVLKDA